jgi:membrane protein DedA with SNARE-associated domain
VDEVLRTVESHGVPIVFAYVFLRQLGLPIPGAPALLMFGALAGAGRVNPWTTLVAAAAGSVAADVVWFEIGRRRGSKVLAFLCKVSLEPDTCVSNTQNLFSRHGAKSLLVAKFVPGFDTVAPPVAGMLGIPLAGFAAWTAGGAVAWLFVYGGLGFVFSDRIADVAAVLDQWGAAVGWTVAGLFVAYIAWKFAQRRRVLRLIRMARITPEELHGMIVGGIDPVVVDARGETALAVLPVVIPGALLIRFEEIDARHAEIPRGKDVIVYCS